MARKEKQSIHKVQRTKEIGILSPTPSGIKIRYNKLHKIEK